MRSDLDHLPDRQQEELQRVRQILLDEFEAAKKQGAGGTSDWRKNGQVLKLILFGSYARSDWVDEPENGYQSDFDILVVVSHPKLTDIADYWWVAEDKILRDGTIGRSVNLIIHTLQEVNDAIRRGEYFWTDIARDGVALYELPAHPLAAATRLAPAQAADAAQKFADQKIPDIERWLETARLQTEKATEDGGFGKLAAFSLHQAAEAAYASLLLVRTLYFPRSHNIKFLRSLAEDVDQSLRDAWPREAKSDRRAFEKLKRAYVEARYSDQFGISSEELDWLAGRVRILRELVVRSCRARLAELKTPKD